MDAKTLNDNFFSTGRLLSGKLEDKLEILKAVCFLTFMINKSFKKDFTAVDVLEKVVYKKKFVETNSFDAFLITIGIISQDLLYGCDDVPNPGYKDTEECCKKIQQLCLQWAPF